MSKTPEQQFQEWMDSQRGNYIGHEKKSEWWKNHNQGQQHQGRLNGIFEGGSNFGVNGASNAEISGRLDGLERAKLLTGQNPYEIGQDYQAAYGNIKKRASLQDTGSEMLRASKAGAVADARNQLQSQGVKGGAALGAVSQVERAKSYDVNNQLMDNQRKAEADYLNAVKANANFTTAAEMGYGALGAGGEFKPPTVGSGGFPDFNTVICTELYRQGFYSFDMYVKDREYGQKVLAERPHVYYGYRLWADYVVKGMQKSKLFTRAVALFALPWAENMAYGNNRFGKLLSTVFEPICGILGKTIATGGYHVTHQEKV